MIIYINIATISLLNALPNKDPSVPSSFCPTFLLNVEIKIITLTLAHRIEKKQKKEITSFIKGSHSTNSTSRIFILTGHSSQQQLQFIIMTY